MESITENIERLDLLQRSLMLEEKQKKRLLDLAIQKKKEIEEADRKTLIERNVINTSFLEKEEEKTNQLVRDMVQKSDGPAVKVLTHIQGKYIFRTYCRRNGVYQRYL